MLETRIEALRKARFELFSVVNTKKLIILLQLETRSTLSMLKSSIFKKIFLDSLWPLKVQAGRLGALSIRL